MNHTWSAIAFFTANIAAITGYVVATALLLREGGWRGRGTLPVPTRLAAVVFFASCSLVHGLLAVSVYTQTPVVDPVTGRVEGMLLAAAILKVGAIYVFLLHSVASPRRGPLAPPVDDATRSAAHADHIVDELEVVRREAAQARENRRSS
jgi:hypothetical protein